MAALLTLAAVFLVASVVPTFARAQRATIAVVGDATSYGLVGENFPQADLTTAEALQAMLRVVSRANPYRRAKVANFGVPGATSRDWIVGPVNSTLCSDWGPHIDHLSAACARGVPLAEVLPARLSVLLVTLGYGDAFAGLPVEETVVNVTAIRARFPNAKVIISPPFVPAFTDHLRRSRDLARGALLAAGLVSGPDWPPLPLVDRVHLTPGGYAAAAGLWLDVLR